VMNAPGCQPMKSTDANAALPPPSVVTDTGARTFSASPWPEGSQVTEAKRAIVNAEFGALSRLPLIVVLLPSQQADVTTGKFWSALGPESASPGSLGVTPSPRRSMPRPPLRKTWFPARTTESEGPWTTMPGLPVLVPLSKTRLSVTESDPPWMAMPAWALLATRLSVTPPVTGAPRDAIVTPLPRLEEIPLPSRVTTAGPPSITIPSEFRLTLLSRTT
jgi:hypothetical protein